MPKLKKKKARKSARRSAADTLDQLRPGMPAKDSIRKMVDFVSPRGTHINIIKTTEMDAYDPALKPPKKRGSKS